MDETLLTIDNLIAKLTEARNNKSNKLGGFAIVHLCLPEIPYVPISDTKLEVDGIGAVFLIMVPEDAAKPIVPNVVIDVEGGVVQGVSSDHPVWYLLLDQDNIQAGDRKPGWTGADEDYKRIAVLKDNPAAEIEEDENEGVELIVECNYVNKPTFTANMVRLKEVTGLEPDAVDNQGSGIRDVHYEFLDDDAFNTAMTVKAKIEAAQLAFVQEIGVHN